MPPTPGHCPQPVRHDRSTTPNTVRRAWHRCAEYRIASARCRNAPAGQAGNSDRVWESHRVTSPTVLAARGVGTYPPHARAAVSYKEVLEPFHDTSVGVRDQTDASTESLAQRATSRLGEQSSPHHTAADGPRGRGAFAGDQVVSPTGPRVHDSAAVDLDQVGTPGCPVRDSDQDFTRWFGLWSQSAYGTLPCIGSSVNNGDPRPSGPTSNAGGGHAGDSRSARFI